MTLSVTEAAEIAALVEYRQGQFADESLHTSVMMAVLNYGDKFVGVRCIRGEWSGVKGDLTPRDGVPLCPNGHVMIEISAGLRLALVPVTA